MSCTLITDKVTVHVPFPLLTVNVTMGWSRTRANILNVNTGSDVNKISLNEFLSFHLAPIPTPILIPPTVPPHPNTTNTDPVSNRPGRMYVGGGEGSLGPLKPGCRLGFFGWEGEEAINAPLRSPLCRKCMQKEMD